MLLLFLIFCNVLLSLKEKKPEKIKPVDDIFGDDDIFSEVADLKIKKKLTDKSKATTNEPAKKSKPTTNKPGIY